MQKSGKCKKLISVALTVLMVLSLIPAVSIAFPQTAQAYGTYTKNYSTEYYYASGTTFIKALCVGYDGSSTSTVRSQMTGASWTPTATNLDMMQDWSGTKHIAVGYRTTTEPTEALTGIKFYDSDDAHSNYSYDGKNKAWPGNNGGGSGNKYVKDSANQSILYYRAGGSPFESYSVDGIVDFLMDMGSGYGYEYLCATTDRAAGAPITAVDCMSSTTSNGYTAVGCVEGGCTYHSSAHNHSKRYVGIKRLTTTVSSDTLRSNYTTALGRYNESSYSSKYTSASRSALESALSTAETILSDLSDGYTTRDQSTINSAATALSNAVSGLTLNTYTVTFKGYTSGTTTGTLKTQTVNWGASATAPSVATTYDSSNHYTFKSWSGSYTNVTANQTVTATYNTVAHTFGSWTNNVSGASGNHKCSCSCGYTKTASHTFTSAVTTQPGCIAAGVRTYTCSVCNNQYTTSEPAQGHSYTSTDTSAAHLKSAATCTTAAVYYKSCIRCGENGTETFTSGSPLNHNFSSQTATDTYLKSAATCTSPAVYYYKCTRCAEKGTNTYEYGSALNHDFTDQVQTDTYLKSAATCTAAAVYYYKCSRCAERVRTPIRTEALSIIITRSTLRK